MPHSRLALLPFSWLYAGLLRLRHALYDAGLWKSIRPTVPTIAIGNLALGGTGKTPMLELILRILEGNGPVATLSRGYGRSDTSFHEVNTGDSADRSGDEPVQVKSKFPDARVFVGADRVAAIERIEREVPGVRAVVLDDALQHRALNASMNILLTTWQRPWCDDALLPAGQLRDLPSRASVAQVVVVTKCPWLPRPGEQKDWRVRLGLNADQDLFFSGIEYEPIPIGEGSKAGQSVLLFTGIANPAPLLDHIRSLFSLVEHIRFPDHHRFTPGDLARLAARFDTFAPGPKMLVTTEKDAARLRSVITGSPLQGAHLVSVGMRAIILNEPERFAELIRHHVATYPAHR